MESEESYLEETKCKVPGCTNTESNSLASVGFHKPPVHKAIPGIREIWKLFCFNDPNISFQPIICSEHFDEEDFIGNYRHSNPQLKKTALPKYRPAEYQLIADGSVENLGEREDEEYLLVDTLEDLPDDMALVEEADDGQEYILSDNVAEAVTSELLLTEGADKEEIVVETESGSYYIVDGANLPKGMSLVEDPNNVIPPLISFDGNLFDLENIANSFAAETDLVQQALSRETSSPIANETLHFDFIADINSCTCSHVQLNKNVQAENEKLESEIADLKILNERLKGKIRSVPPAPGGVMQHVSNLFTESQLEKLRGHGRVDYDTWGNRDYQRSLFLHTLNADAYRYFRSKYNYPMPKVESLKIFRKLHPEHGALIAIQVQELRKNSCTLLNTSKKH
ncbi:hypothetical protein DMENIID0001_135100 [Sergentomyia squamirostris]